MAVKLPGVVKLWYFSAYLLPDFLEPILYENIVFSPCKEILLSDVGSLSEESEAHPLGMNVSTNLEFASEEEIPLTEPVAFMVFDAEGGMYIVGNKPPVCGALKKKALINTPSDKASINYYSFSIPVAKFKLT